MNWVNIERVTRRIEIVWEFGNSLFVLMENVFEIGTVVIRE